MRDEKAEAIAQDATASSETMATDNQVNGNYINPFRLSRVKPRESLCEQVAKLIVYLEDPLLCEAERKHSWMLFWATLS